MIKKEIFFNLGQFHSFRLTYQLNKTDFLETYSFLVFVNSNLPTIKMQSKLQRHLIRRTLQKWVTSNHTSTKLGMIFK